MGNEAQAYARLAKEQQRSQDFAARVYQIVHGSAPRPGATQSDLENMTLTEVLAKTRQLRETVAALAAIARLMSPARTRVILGASAHTPVPERDQPRVLDYVAQRTKAIRLVLAETEEFPSSKEPKENI